MNNKANKGSLPRNIDYNCEVLINVDDSPTGHLLGNHGDTDEEKNEDNGLVETLDSSNVSLPQETVDLTHEHVTLIFCTKENIKLTRSGNLFTTNAFKALKDHPKLSITKQTLSLVLMSGIRQNRTSMRPWGSLMAQQHLTSLTSIRV